MRSDRSIVWLASYPKSGNTWLRILLANYMSGAQGPAGIDQLELFPIASLRRLFDDLVGIEASDLTAAEITAYRGEAYRVLAREHPPPVFVKVHDAYQTSDEGTPLFPAEITRCVVYVVRNPLDLVVSLAHHSGCSLDDAIGRICNGLHMCAPGRALSVQLEQRVGAWSAHVRGWLEAPMAVRLVRYEDMVDNPQRTFASALEAAGISVEPERLARAIECSRFETLQRVEAERGFAERPPTSKAFFRSGRVGEWRDALSAGQVERIIDAHGEVMQRLGYSR